jgi:tRNA G46 methylase TrmB
MDGNSRSVTSPQQGPHGRLEETVRRHMRSPWRRPVAAHTREAFAALDERLDRSRPLVLDTGCGTGASSRILARRHPGAQVVGIDKSADRLARAPAGEEAGASAPWLVRADLQDFWRLALAADWRPAHQYLLYPNPWPKPSGFGRRWHGHPVLPVILALGGRIELRSNWALYVREFALALEIWGIDSRIDVLERIPDEGPLTPFERKYLTSGQRCWRLLAESGTAADRDRVLELAGPERTV